MLWPQKTHTRNLITKKIPAVSLFYLLKPTVNKN